MPYNCWLIARNWQLPSPNTQCSFTPYNLSRLHIRSAGGQPAGLGLFENLIKECAEEAGISEAQASQSIATGTVSYRYTDGRGLKRDVLYCYDLELPDGFVPKCQDGEVESFERLPIQEVLTIIETTDAFKYNCNLVIIDFAIRHGILTGDNTPEYASLCERRNQLKS